MTSSREKFEGVSPKEGDRSDRRPSSVTSVSIPVESITEMGDRKDSGDGSGRRDQCHLSGTAATFVIVSPTLITTSVPTGAATGTVQVTTPGGVLSSNVAFRVTP